MSDRHFDELTALAARVSADDPRATEPFARGAGRWLCRFMAKWLPEGEDYEQTALDALGEVVDSLEQFSSEKGGIYGWMRRIAWRRVSDFYRRREKRMRLENRAGGGGVENLSLSQRANAQTKDDLLAIMASMKADEIELLRLFFEEKLPDSSVAEIMNITPDNARQRKRRLLHRLQKAVLSLNLS